MSISYRLVVSVLSLIAASSISAVELEKPYLHPAPAIHPLRVPPLGSGNITKPGQLDYAFFYDMQAQLQSYQPREPRLVDLWLQARYAEMTEMQRDAYVPSGAGVDILGRSIDIKLPMKKGGYFILPSLADAYNDNAAISFDKLGKDSIVNVAWAVRVDAKHSLTYATLQNALAEVRTVQGKIPFQMAQLGSIKSSVYSGIKACFGNGGGQVLIGGKPVEGTAVGNCTVVKLDSAYPHPDDIVEFSGPLDMVTLVDTRVYEPTSDAQPRIAGR